MTHTLLGTAQAVGPASSASSSTTNDANGAPSTNDPSSASNSITTSADLDAEETDNEDDDDDLLDADDDTPSEPDTDPATPTYPRPSMFLQGALGAAIVERDKQQKAAEAMGLEYILGLNKEEDQACNTEAYGILMERLGKEDAVAGIPTREILAWIESGLEGIHIYGGIRGTDGAEDRVVAVDIDASFNARILVAALDIKTQTDKLQQRCKVEVEAALLNSVQTQARYRTAREDAVAAGDLHSAAEHDSAHADLMGIVRRTGEEFDLYSGFDHQRYRPSVYSTFSI